MWRTVGENVGSTDVYLIITGCGSRQIIFSFLSLLINKRILVVFIFLLFTITFCLGNEVFQQSEEGRERKFKEKLGTVLLLTHVTSLGLLPITAVFKPDSE